MYNVCVADTDSDSSSDSEADDVKASPANVAKVLFDYLYYFLPLFDFQRGYGTTERSEFILTEVNG